MFDLIKWFGHL